MFVNLIVPTYTTNQNHIETTKEKQQMKLQLQKPESAFTNEKKNKPWNKIKTKWRKRKEVGQLSLHMKLDPYDS